MHAFMKFADAGCKFGKVFVTINTFNKNFEIFFGKHFFFTKYFYAIPPWALRPVVTGARAYKYAHKKL